MPLENQFWGDRYGSVRDPFDVDWSIGGPVKG
jgi:PhnB protein